ncbi:HU family DNA-binding protein [Actinobacillus equuli subsp. equuli]|uniref:HU family DNA-binding protein n=5 Tax=Actinobacillus TaxID=713 RepID=A0A9X4JCJ9_ACTEU|nr:MULTISPECIES: HU family DNA-binding protein [Actinobacillus]MDE8033913.1 HU family DNA-binding protein [Actinobacillus equuli subsp. equuli]MDG4948045.1 HU family DNA-binding protein [Actinobacillus equuli subsp. haemolyticus]MDG4952719.1 HU family DNA-binding protein [Actinobacillus equuli subsp. equuli]WGE72333.1 HU family DNA-binding protein [Actinobacillus equuli subsp. haemolyticus]
MLEDTIMNKTELIDAIAAGAELSKKDAKAALEATLEAISESLKKGDAVQLIGFGTFKVNERNARTGRNPRTGEEIKIAAAKVPAFVAGKALKDLVK